MHTPRDLRWTGKNYVSDDDRRAYADTLVGACRVRGIQGIAVTDHHDMVFAGIVRKAAGEETTEVGEPIPTEERLVVFPAMELTLGVPCQALLIFDADFPEDMFALAMSALTIKPNGEDQAKAAAVKRLDHIQSLKVLTEELDKHSYLRERYIVFPNVSEGKFSLLRTGQAGKYIEMPCVGGYVDGDVAKLGQGNRDILAGKAREWGNKRIACYQASGRNPTLGARA